MVHLSKILLLRQTGFQTPWRVNRTKYIAKGAEYLFKDASDVKKIEALDGTVTFKTNKVIRLALDGCTNRPFYRIILANRLDDRSKEIEQLGSFDPMPNMHNEKLCALNFERLKYHLAMGAHIAKPVRRLLGLSGFLPLDPTLFVYVKGLRRRREIERLIAESEEKNEEEIDSEEKES